MKKNSRTMKLAICAMMVALGTALSFIKIFDSPLGGSVTLFSMVPVLFIGFKYGVAWGFGSAFVYSVLQLLFGLSAVTYVPTPTGVAVCVLLDYIVAFSLLGLTGFFRRRDGSVTIPLVIAGSLTACAARFLSHFICGGAIWYEITKNGGWNDYVMKYSKWVYSFIYQIIYLGPETVLVLIATPVIIIALRRTEKAGI